MTAGVTLSGRGLVRRFVTGESTRVVLNEVSLAVEPGQLVLVRGPSGCGKTTLLHLLATLDRPDHGTVEIGGRDVTTLSGEERARVRRHQLGVVYQEGALVSRWRVWQNVAVSLIPDGIPAPERRRRATEVLERVGLAARRDDRSGPLSGGERQRVAIARALIGSPSLLIADEPTSQVDGETGQGILELFDALRGEGAGLLIASHDEAFRSRATQSFRLADGRLHADDSSEER